MKSTAQRKGCYVTGYEGEYYHEETDFSGNGGRDG